MGGGGAEANSSANRDCLSCRLIGSGTMLAVSGYTMLQRMNMPKNQPGQRLFLLAMATGFAGLGVARFTWKP